MTKNQITTSLNLLDYKSDEWTSINKIRIIFLDQDVAIYNDLSHYRFKFNTSTDLLEIATGYIDTNGVFKTYSGYDESNLQADAFYDFSDIAGLITTEGMDYNHYADVQFGNNIR